MACAFETIKREHEGAQTVSYVYSSSSRNPSARKLTSTSKRTAAEILQAEEDDNNFGDINDFK
jgi:hypothetical protein